MQAYIDAMLVRLKAILTEEKDIPQPRIFAPGDRVALISMVEVPPATHSSPPRPIYASKVEARTLIPPAQWEGGRRPFDLNCVMTEVVSSSTEGYEVRALLSPAIAARHPHINVDKSPRFVTHLDRDQLSWDYADHNCFAWRDRTVNKTLYPYPVDAHQPLYVDLEYFLVLIIGLDGVFRTTVDNVVRFLVNYMDSDVIDRLHWGEKLLEQLTELHYLTFLHHQLPYGQTH